MNTQELAESITAEIKADIADGTLPSHGITCYADLHDYVDANTYGLENCAPLEGEEMAASMDAAQSIVDAWLRHRSDGVRQQRNDAAVEDAQERAYEDNDARRWPHGYREYVRLRGGLI